MEAKTEVLVVADCLDESFSLLFGFEADTDNVLLLVLIFLVLFIFIHGDNDVYVLPVLSTIRMFVGKIILPTLLLRNRVHDATSPVADEEEDDGKA